jgi:putative nucleotidyltransferase with HDIG domain
MMKMAAALALISLGVWGVLASFLIFVLAIIVYLLTRQTTSNEDSSSPSTSGNTSAPLPVRAPEPAPTQPKYMDRLVRVSAVQKREVVSCPTIRKDMKPASLNKITEWVAEFPPLSPITSRLLTEISSPQPHPDRVKSLVSQDPMLVIEMLRLANSAATAQTKIVTSLEQAIMLLGFDAVLSVAMRGTMAAMAKQFPTGGFDHHALLRHNVVTGLMAGALARRMPQLNAAEATTAGLLHDVGKVVMNISYSSVVSNLMDIKTTVLGESRLAKEERLFGASHAVIGSVLVSRWKLPESLINTIELHHHPSVTTLKEFSVNDRNLTAVVFVANQLAKYVNCPGGDLEIDLPSPELLDTIKKSGHFASNQLLQMLEVSDKVTDDYEAILQQIMPNVSVALEAFLKDTPLPQK